MRLQKLRIVFVLAVIALLVGMSGPQGVKAQSNGYTITVIGNYIGGEFVYPMGMNRNGDVMGVVSTPPSNPEDPYSVMYRMFFHKASTGVTTDLGEAESTANFPVSINNAGQILWVQNTLNEAGTRYTYRSYLYTPGTGSVELTGGGATNVYPVALNDSGHVTGIADFPDFSNLIPLAYRYVPGEGIASIAATAGPNFITTARGMNSAGDVVGSSQTSSWRNMAFVNKFGVGNVDLGLLGTRETSGAVINDHGQVAGEHWDSSVNNSMKIFVYTPSPGVGMVDIGAPAGTINPRVRHLNNKGQVAGYAFNTTIQGVIFYLWDPAAGYVDMVPGGRVSNLLGMNNHGHVVGYSVGADGSGSLFLYKDGVASSLYSLLPPDLDLYIEQIWNINDNGQISGSGWVNGVYQAFVLTPNSPPSNTPPGEGVVTVPEDESGSGTPVTITFGEVVTGGETTLTTTPTGPPPPSGFKIGTPPVYYNLETTAVFNGSATLCINYSSIGYGNEAKLKLLHMEDGAWVDRTSSLDTVNNVICATVTSFSPFIIVEPEYTFTGFFSPVDNGGVLNSVKAGSSVPVKFGLGGDQGMDVLYSGYPRSVVIPCDSGAPVDAVEETLSTSASGLTYDPAARQYRYVWKTDKSWDGCRQFVLKLSDGNTYTANFKFTR